MPAKPLDDAIAARLLIAVTPLTIKLALEALSNLGARDKAISAQWRRKIERARYNADLAKRRYEEADSRLRSPTFNVKRRPMRSLTPEQNQQILQLSKDFPRLSKAPTTSACDRKRMLRLLIRDVTVVKEAEPKLLHLQICWQGGATETILSVFESAPEVRVLPSPGVTRLHRYYDIADPQDTCIMRIFRSAA